jgi:hypothetical protein
MKLLVSALLSIPVALGLAAVDEGRDPSCPIQGGLAAGPQHALLQKLAGTWDATLVVHDPSGTESRSRGTLTRARLAGFHVVDSFEGTLMGAPFAGHGITGYCGVSRKFFSFWADSMTPSPMTLSGDFDEKKRELVLTGECYGMSGKLEKCRTVTRFADDDHMTWALFGTLPDGKEAQFLGIEYTRKR